MKAKFFNNKFFFGVFVVIAVVCLFLLFFRVVHAQSHSVLRSDATVGGVLQVGETVRDMTSVAVNRDVQTVSWVPVYYNDAGIHIDEVPGHAVESAQQVKVNSSIVVYPSVYGSVVMMPEWT